MKYFFTFLLANAFMTASAQKANNKLYNKFVSADSVVLVSHLETYIFSVNEETGERIPPHLLVKKNTVNYNIIKERFKLDKKEIDSIATIMLTRNSDSLIQDIQCFIPHHGILLFKKGKCSFFDICFGCRHFVTSKDIKLSDELDDRTWNALETFFRNRKLDYELPKNDEEELEEN